jgi:transcriptional regulator with XRE-family HTH domain
MEDIREYCKKNNITSLKGLIEHITAKENISQRELSLRMGYSKNTVYEWVHKNRFPAQALYGQIEEELGRINPIYAEVFSYLCEKRDKDNSSRLPQKRYKVKANQSSPLTNPVYVDIFDDYLDRAAMIEKTAELFSKNVISLLDGTDVYFCDIYLEFLMAVCVISMINASYEGRQT